MQVNYTEYYDVQINGLRFEREGKWYFVFVSSKHWHTDMTKIKFVLQVSI
jgi:hypothetical protein